MRELALCALYWCGHQSTRTARGAARATRSGMHAALQPPAPPPVWQVLPTPPAYHHRPITAPDQVPDVALVRPYAPAPQEATTR